MWISGRTAFCAKSGAYSFSKAPLLLKACKGHPAACGRSARGKLWAAGAVPAGLEAYGQSLGEACEELPASKGD